jgi:hypothetical protein
LAAVIACAGTTASAQVSPIPSKVPCKACFEEVAVVPHLANLFVGPHGVNSGWGGGFGRSCNTIASLTDASFTGGSYIMEAGMANGEMAAATYVVPATEFPIKINLSEIIVVQQGATVATTTQWSILFYSGTPTTGTLVNSYSSDDVIIPHIHMPPGTQGMDVQFSIDPNDPDQLIINAPADGSHSFTVAFRIDHLNNPSSSPCFQGAPTDSNAFPCVDTSGVSSLPNNWLYGINCGSLGCPANGGWASFAALPSYCRPSGDWVMRTTWSSVPNCTPGVGACCLPNGTCSVLAVADCGNQGGQYLGDGVSCTGANCVAQTGACCKPDGTCVAGQTSSQCTSQGGTFQGAGTACGNCPQPTGACCFSNGNCLNFTSANCTTAGGTWLGAGSACNGTGCPTGACCLPSGACLTSVTANQCSAQGGTFRGVGTNCSTQCPQPTGACCLSNGNCLVLTQSDCSVIGSTNWAGAGTTCTAGTCSTPCYPNCDQSTQPPILNANDFQCFLNKFAAADSYANCDQSTQPPILNANDFQCFLNKYAAGCS